MKFFPLTDEQIICYEILTKDIRDMVEAISSKTNFVNGKFHFIQGKAGVGKTEFAKKLMCYCFSIGGIALGCAATALAATIYIDYGFETTHSLFKIPVNSDNDKDENEFQCKLDDESQRERNELLNETTLIIWDECCSNHSKIFESILNSKFGFKNTVVVCLGSYEQILPILTNNPTKKDILDSCLCKSFHWNLFQKHTFTKNKRIIENNIIIENKNAQQEFEIFVNALSCNNKLLDGVNIFGESNILFQKPLFNENNYEIPEEILKDIEYYKIRNLKIFEYDKSNEMDVFDNNLNKNVANIMDFLYPDGFDNSDKINSYVVAATNEQIHFWNNEIQKNNKNRSYTLFSKNEFADIDDPYNNLKQLFLCENLNEKLINHDVPVHKLVLKIDDICLLSVNYYRKIGLTKNRKVIIKSIDYKKIAIVIAGKSNYNETDWIWIPRIKFRFRYNNGNSFAILRTQFPLRLAYCLTYNKSQGQTCNRLILDTTYPPFSHGHFYVAITRCRDYRNIALFCTDDQIIKDDNSNIICANLPNIMHKEILQEYN